MAASSQICETNNVTVESDKVIEFINPFKNHQQHQLEDFNLFLSVSRKCRCCFSKLINESDQHTVKPWHRQAFLALTGVEILTLDSENFLCPKCAEILKIYTDLGKTAANLQKKYTILMQDLASDIKTERDETNKISGHLQDCSDIVISDDESVGVENLQPQQTDSSDLIQNGIIHDNNISMEEHIQTVENSARVNKCTVRLTRIDPEKIDKYKYYSRVGSTEEQTIDQILSTNGKLKRTIQEDSQTCTNLKIIRITENNTKCHFCGMIYKSKKSLRRHVRDHHNKTRPSCDLCGKSLARKDGIVRHMQIYHLNLNMKFNCNLCSTEFESSAKLLDHKRSNHYKNLKCEECDAAFGKRSLLLKHIKAIHDIKQWYCHYQDCSSSFPLKSYAKQHFQNVHALQGQEIINKYLKTEKNYQSLNIKCQICGMIAKNQEDMYAHFRNTHTKAMGFSCDLCGKTFSHKHKMDLINHMHKHQVVKFNCNLCPAEFQSNLKLMIHKNSAHNKKFKCEKCDASFSELYYLKDHVKGKHEGKRYHCQVPGCLKSHSLIRSARKHLKIDHSLKKEVYTKYSAKLNPKVERKVDLNCQICGRNFMKRNTMRDHIREIHNKNKSCDFCDKTFSRKRYIIDHMHTYHMNLKFKCDLCPLELRSELKLKLHKRVAHKKNLKCDKCNSTFGNPYRLKEHVKVKHEGKRYHCSYPECSATFSTKGVTSRHLVAVHSLVGENFNKFHKKITMQ